MKPSLRVGAPPGRPLVVYDGDCGFCKFWIQRWAHTTGEQVEYLPARDPAVIRRFPEIPREQFEQAVQLIEPDGQVYSGAEAAFRALAKNRSHRWWQRAYDGIPPFAVVTEWVYHLVARHRAFFSLLTRIGWGRHSEPPSQLLVRQIFLRGLGVIFFAAFVSLWVQITGLVGEHGIMPARLTMEGVREQADAGGIGWNRYHLVPTLCWFSASDGFLKAQCAAGTVLALLLIAGIAPAPCLFLLWLIYLSLTTIGREFLAFQWDALLLQTGFLAIFFAPMQLFPRAGHEAPPSRTALWLLRLLLFLLMFESGVVKLTSGDPTWRGLVALAVHYETQPLPTWIGWYAHQAPLWFHKTCTVLMFGIELLAPFLIFAPRRLRHLGAFALIALQVFILLTGNYCFFNLLTLSLCVVLFDDAAFGKCIPARWREVRLLDRLKRHRPAKKGPPPLPRRLIRWPVFITGPIALLMVLVSVVQLLAVFRLQVAWPAPVLTAYQWFTPFRTLNSYGLFAVMTTTRPEIVVEGSDDGVNWKAYEFRYKPGDVTGRPRFITPHQPRLDWQMWFAALGNYQQNPWFVNFCVRLLQGEPEVMSMLAHNPFPEAPPKYLRALVYQYQFTDAATRRQTGAWWRRELKGEYLPAISWQPAPEP